MIVTALPENTLRVVAQPDHAVISAQLAQRWHRPELIPEPVWPRLLHAVREHDAGWLAAERMPSVDTRGRPHNFKSIATDEHVAIWHDSIAHLRQQDDYAALLVTLHARWLYTHVATNAERELATVQRFVSQLDDLVDVLLRRLEEADEQTRQAVTPHALEAARRLLGLLDALSLMLAGGLKVDGLPEPVCFAQRNVSLKLSWHDEPPTLLVGPWPFDSQPFSIDVPARQIPNRRYRSAIDLANAIRRADPQRLTRHIRPA